MHNFYSLDLQLFADGEGGAAIADTASTGSEAQGNTSGVTAEPSQQSLAELGVPQNVIDAHNAKIAKRNKRMGVAAAQTISKEAETAQQPAEQQKSIDTNEAAKKQTLRELIKADPDLNSELQTLISERVKSAKSSQAMLNKLKPTLDAIGRIHGIDMSNLDSVDFDALNEKINADDPAIDQKALELGISHDNAKAIIEAERIVKQQDEERQISARQQLIQNHLQSLYAQASEMQAEFPDFNLEVELQNDDFRRLTQPGVNVPLRTAYYVVHEKEIQQAQAAAVAKATQEKISASFKVNNARPQEVGANAQAANISTINMKDPAFRAEIKARMQEAARQGKSLYADGTIR